MLSGETSVGKFPVGAVHVMSRVAEVTENYLISQGETRDLPLKLKTMALSSAVAKGVRVMVTELRAKLVVVWSQTGSTARIFSKTRFPVPIIALSSDHRALRRMSLHFGVIPQETQPPEDTRSLVRQADEIVRDGKFASVGDRIVIVAGTSLGTPRMLNGVLIHTVGGEPEHLSEGAPPMVQSEEEL
jgi:pyruvate kinase